MQEAMCKVDIILIRDLYHLSKCAKAVSLFRAQTYGHLNLAPTRRNGALTSRYYHKNCTKAVSLAYAHPTLEPARRNGAVTSKSRGSAYVPSVGRYFHSGPHIDLPKFTTLTHFLFKNASQYSQKIALVDGVSGESLTYQQLEEQIDNVTRNLYGLGFRQGDVVTIYGTNRMQFVHVLCACANLGVTVSLANCHLPTEELKTQLTLSQTKLVVTSHDCASVAVEASRSVGCETPFVMGEAANCRPFSSLISSSTLSGNVRSEVTSQDVALLPFSSGTTGLPKGVKLSHANLCSELLALGHPSYLPMTSAKSTSICALPMVHIAGLVIGTLNALAQGATTVVLHSFSMESFLRAIQVYEGTFALIAPPVMTMLAKSPVALNYDLSSLASLYSGAACLERELTVAVAERLNINCIRQGYGMTETSPATHSCQMEGWKFGSVGMPLPNTDCKVVDMDTGQDQGVGVEGEVWVRGPQVMLGYHDNEKETTEAFAGDGWLKTGDIGYFDSDGHYFIVDRLKDIIKYKGYQVSPAYLESVLLSHPSVADVAVVGVPQSGVGDVPEAWVVRKHPCSEEDLLAFVADRVAPFKRIRGGVRFVTEIPRSASGKILRRTLRQTKS